MTRYPHPFSGAAAGTAAAGRATHNSGEGAVAGRAVAGRAVAERARRDEMGPAAGMDRGACKAGTQGITGGSSTTSRYSRCRQGPQGQGPHVWRFGGCPRLRMYCIGLVKNSQQAAASAHPQEGPAAPTPIKRGALRCTLCTESMAEGTGQQKVNASPSSCCISYRY
jgi:hypothetical protein